MPTTEPNRLMTRRKVSAEASRRKLLAAALDHFSRRPYNEVTVGDIVQSAGVAHGLLFHHFRNKQGLYLETLQEADRQLRETREPDPGLPAGERLRRSLGAHLEYLAAHEDFALNLVLRGVGAGPEAWEAFEAGRTNGIRVICDLLHLDPEHLAVQMMMRSYVRAADEITLHWLRNHRPFEVASIVETLVHLLDGAIRGAHRLDPELNITQALAALATDD